MIDAESVAHSRRFNALQGAGLRFEIRSSEKSGNLLS